MHRTLDRRTVIGFVAERWPKGQRERSPFRQLLQLTSTRIVKVLSSVRMRRAFGAIDKGGAYERDQL
jgi:hypothetical protein